MTSIATGGFSNYDASNAYFDNAGTEWAMSVIMLLGSVPFVPYLRAVRGNLRNVYAETQLRLILHRVPAYVGTWPCWFFASGFRRPFHSLRHRPFHGIPGK